MKYNKRQMAYSARKIYESKFGLLVRMFTFALMLFFAVGATTVVQDPQSVKPVAEMGIGMLILLTMAQVGNLAQPSSVDTAANQIGFRLYLVARDQIDDTVAFPLPNSARELGNIPLKAGELWHYFEGVENSIKYTGTGEAGDITPTFGKTIPIIIKYSNEALNFVEQYTGKGFVVAWPICETSEKEIVGTFCKPIKLQKFEVKQDADGKYIMLEFGNTHWRQPLKYVGDLTFAAATTVAAGATALTVGASGLYQLSDHTATVILATVSGLTADDYGRYITLNAPAAATNAPTIADNSVYILRDGDTWTANPGSSITFQVLDDSTLVEISRVQTT
ncbi:MAG: hypothetical protein JZU49_00930 [Sulfuricurvum sp.]|nr:hypothetical protein [Sulfuricurvum sp.]